MGCIGVVCMAWAVGMSADGWSGADGMALGMCGMVEKNLKSAKNQRPPVEVYLGSPVWLQGVLFGSKVDIFVQKLTLEYVRKVCQEFASDIGGRNQQPFLAMPGEMPPLPLLAAGALLLCAIGTFLFRRRASALLSSLDSLSKERGKGATTEKLIVEHDVVVLGAGCSACALVSTLVKGGKRVLLLEGGEEDVYRQAPPPLESFSLCSCQDPCARALQMHTP